jgi:mannose-1-phosphate guanylyltransferase/mannose-6-phosphate isomerase
VPISPSDKAQLVEAFFEKPGVEKAAQYIASGYLWNSGNFLFRADVMTAEIERFAPAVAAAAHLAVEHATRDLDFLRLAEEPFAQSPKISIDYAVMERTARAAVLAVDFQWSDVGNWDAVHSFSEADANGNAVTGQVELLNTSNSLVISDDNMLTAVVGCDDIVVVTTADAVLVTSRQHAESIKDIVEQMRRGNRIEVLEHRRMYRPWGYYQGVDKGTRFQVKRIVVKPDGKLSLQKHFHRAEHWVVVHGTAAVTVNERELVIHENESVYIPIGAVHRLANPGRIPLELIEVQVGSYLGEDDIVRLDDVYHR